MSREGDYPDSVRHLPLETQVAVLYERVQGLSEDLRSVKRALWSVVGSVIGGAILLLFSVAVGWLGPHSTVSGAIRAIGGFFS